MYNEWQVHHAGMHACSSAQHLGSTSSSHSCCQVWNQAAHTCLQVSHQSLRQQGSFQEVRFVLKRIKNHSKVRVTGFQDSLALPLLSLMPGEACALLFTNGKIRCCTSMMKIMLYCQLLSAARGRPDPEQAACAPVQGQIAFRLQQVMYSCVDCTEAAGRRLSGFDWLQLCAAAGPPASPSDNVKLETPGRTGMRCLSSVTL